VRFHFINRRENEDLCGSEIAQKLGRSFRPLSTRKLMSSR
jgi:hypothetical protein